MCGKELKVFVESGFDYKEITVRCGNTSPTGEPWLCDECEKQHGGRDWRREAIEAGECWDEEDY
jgi:hypothetical protein